MLLSRTTLPLLCLAAGSLALPTEHLKRDITVIQNSLHNVEGVTTRLLGSLKYMDRKLSASEYSRAWPEVTRDSRQLVDTLTRDASDIRRSPMVQTLEATALITPINNLETLISKVVDEWIAVKPTLAAQERQTVQRILRDQQVAAGTYADAIVSRQSALSSQVGRLLGTQTQNSIQRALNAYRF